MKTLTTGTVGHFITGGALVALSCAIGCSVGATEDTQEPISQPLTSVSSDACAASYSLLDQWNGGFKAEISFENKTSQTLSWRGALEFTGGETVKSNWRSQLLSAGSTPSFGGESYNASLEPGESVTFGFVGEGSPATPTNFSLNGQSCAGGNTSPGDTDSGSQPGDSNSSDDEDECNSTSECKVAYGDSATDCVDSQSSGSWCECGNAPCAYGTPGETDPGGSGAICEDGILNGAGSVCCAASCGSCGGTGCASRPGGADACCAGAVASSARSCDDYGAPCIVEGGEGSPGDSNGGGSNPGNGAVPQPPASCSNTAYDIPGYLEVHTVIDKHVSRAEFSSISSWYTEDDNVQRFQLHEGDQNQQNPNILRPRVEAYAPFNDVWTRTGQNDWHEFSANYYLDSWDSPWRYAIFQIKTNDQSNFIIQGLIDDDGSLNIGRRSKGWVTLDNNVFQKPFHLRVRSNGYKFEVYYNCELVLAENHPQPQLESNQTRYGFRWGLYRQKEEADDTQKGTTTMFVTGPKWD